MREEIQTRLKAKFPSMIPERFYFECGDGWESLVEGLLEALQWETDRKGAPQVVLVQVKEKFAGLRVYTNASGSPEQEAMIRFVEFLSFRVCENCGTTKEVAPSGKGWIKSLCPSCRETP